MEVNQTTETNVNPDSNEGNNHINIATALFVIMAVIALIASFGYLFYVWQKKQVPTPLPLSESLPKEKSANNLAQVTPSPQTWSSYTDTATGLSFTYPPSVSMFGKTADEEKMVLWLSVQKLADIPEDLPSQLGRKDAIQQKDRLESGVGEGIIKVGNLNAEVGYTYSQFEMCNVTFARKLILYPGEYRVVMTLSAIPEKIIAEMPEFFHSDVANCGEKQIWNQNMMSSFEETLVQGKGKGMAQEWYNSFNQIIQSIKFEEHSAE